MSIKVFLSYAKADVDWLNKLEIFLAPLKNNELIKTWSNQELVAGSPIEKTSSQELLDANIVLLLVTANYLASGYYSTEMQTALERHYLKQVVVIPILVKPCLWEDAPFAGITPLPKDGIPISKALDLDEALTEVVIGIKEVIGE